MSLQAAIDAPRIHSEGNLFEVLMEERVPEDVRRELSRMGHEIVVRPRQLMQSFQTRFAKTPPWRIGNAFEFEVVGRIERHDGGRSC